MATVRVTSDRALVRARGGSCRAVRIELVAGRSPPGAARRPLNVAFVLDRSGSMGGGKLDLARKATIAALDLLGERDRVAVVFYDDRVEVAIPGTPLTSSVRAQAAEWLAPLMPRGSTDLALGWETGCAEVAMGLRADQVARCLLLTDGRANRGVRDPGDLRELAAAVAARGIGTSTFGLGVDFDEHLLRGMSDAGGGNFFYVPDEHGLRDALRTELCDALDLVHRDAWLRITLPTGANVQVLGPEPARQAGPVLELGLGSLVADEVREVALLVTFPPGRPGQLATLAAGLRDREGPVDAESAVSWAWADDGANDRQGRDRAVSRLVAFRRADLARAEALRRLDAHDVDAACDGLLALAERLAREDDLAALAEELRADARRMAAGMDPQARKRLHFDTSTRLWGREQDGRAKRKPR